MKRVRLTLPSSAASKKRCGHVRIRSITHGNQDNLSVYGVNLIAGGLTEDFGDGTNVTRLEYHLSLM
jgi:hypothetical protein